MTRQHPNPTEKMKKDKSKKHPSKPSKSEPPKNGTMQTAGILLLGGGGVFAFLRYLLGELWAKEIARKFYDWIWPKLYDDINLLNPLHWIRYGMFLSTRVQFQQNAPTYFLYFMTTLVGAIPTVYVTWRKVIKPRFFCETDPITDECIDPPCVGGECKEGEESDPDEESDNEGELVCEQRTEMIAGRPIKVQVCLTAEDREAIEQAKRKEAKEALAAAQKSKAIKKEKKEETPLLTAALPGEGDTASPAIPPTGVGKQNPVILESGEGINLDEECDCEEDPDLTLPRTLLTMAGNTPMGSRFTGESKHRTVTTSESREATDTQACEHKTQVAVAETGHQSQHNRRGSLFTRVFH